MDIGMSVKTPSAERTCNVYIVYIGTCNALVSQ
jgi:hypothetical protein